MISHLTATVTATVCNLVLVGAPAEVGSGKVVAPCDPTNTAAGGARIYPVASANVQSADSVEALVRGFALDEAFRDAGKQPSEWSIDQTLKTLRALSAMGIVPDYVIPMADGGVSLMTSMEERTARLEVSNDELIVLTTRRSAESAPEYLEVDLEETASLVAEFLGV